MQSIRWRTRLLLLLIIGLQSLYSILMLNHSGLQIQTKVRTPLAPQAFKSSQALHPELLQAANRHNTKLLPTDLIYSRDWWDRPTVIEEYKLIFFTIPKNGSTEWKLLFRRMMGMSIPYDARSHHQVIMPMLDPATNNLTTLDRYPTHVAEGMMKSPQWTKAVFLRDPKERLLSTFLDKFVSKDYFIRFCCKNGKRDECQHKRQEQDFSYFLNSNCTDPHWEAQMDMIDEKWWPYINFIGLFQTIEQDSKRLLESLISSKDGESAWEKVGKSGWGANGQGAFLQQNGATHNTGAKDLIARYYNKEYETLVEKKWKVEWESPYSPF